MEKSPSISTWFDRRAGARDPQDRDKAATSGEWQIRLETAIDLNPSPA